MGNVLMLVNSEPARIRRIKLRPRKRDAMNLNEFVIARKSDWERLLRIAARVKPGGNSGLTKLDLWDLGRLYMAAIADLSLVRASAFGADRRNQVTRYLNNVVVRVHGLIYRKASFDHVTLRRYFTHELPSTVRNLKSFVFFSLSLFMLFGAVGYYLGLTTPGFIEHLVSPKIIDTVEKGDVWFKDLFAIAPMAAGGLMTHNISVTFLMIAAGITFGVGTIYLMGLNGLLIGTVAALCAKHGLTTAFWSFVLPHGSLEISAIILAGAAGLSMGYALVDPGPYRRSERLALESRNAGVIALACVPLLIMAAVIEAFLSPSPLPVFVKILFACVSFISLLTYLSLSGK